MANGNVAHLLCEPETTPHPAPSAIELAIGKAAANAVEGVVWGTRQHAAGELKRAAKTAGGDAIFALYRLRQELGEPSFTEAVHRQGKAEVRRRLGDAVADKVIDELLSWPLSILNRVIELEAIYAQAHAH